MLKGKFLKGKFKISLIKTNQKIGRVVPEMSNEYIREIIEGNYRIIYMIVSESRVDILTVHHSSKELKIAAFL